MLRGATLTSELRISAFWGADKPVGCDTGPTFHALYMGKETRSALSHIILTHRDTMFQVGSDTVIEWLTVDPNAAIAPSTQLSGFTVASDSPPGLVSYVIFDDSLNAFQDQTTGPILSTVPEPSGIGWMFGAVLGTAGCLCWHRLRR